MHASPQSNDESLRMMSPSIAWPRRRGYRFVTFSELLGGNGADLAHVQRLAP